MLDTHKLSGSTNAWAPDVSVQAHPKTRNMNINALLRAVLGVLCLCFIALIGWNLRDTTAKEGGAAPKFSIQTDEGHTITPTSFGGKVLVLNFWASWCAPCVQEIPSLSVFERKFAPQGVVVVAISIDKNPQKYKSFLDKIRPAFQTARDGSSDISTSYGTFQIPETYIIKDGKVMRKFGNAEDWTSDDITQYVQSLL